MTQPQTPERANPFAPPQDPPLVPAQYPPPAWPPYETAPWQYAPPPAPPAPPTGFAVAALVLGIVAMMLFWLPLAGLVPGLLAIVFGAVAARRSGALPTRQDHGKAVAGIATGSVAIVASIAFFALVVAAVDDAPQAGTGSAAVEQPESGSAPETVDPPAEPPAPAPAPPTVPEVAQVTTTYEESFEAGAGRFEVSTYDDWVGEHRDGAYFLSSPETDTVSWSSARIGAATAVDLSATVEMVAGTARDSGMGLLVQPNDNEGYVFTVYGDGYVTVSRSLASEEFVLDLTGERTSAPDGPTALRMTVAWTAEATEIVGYVDGQEVVRYVDSDVSEDVRWPRFDQAGVVLSTGERPGTVRADDVVVRTAG